VIAHFDIDAFYASVAQRDDPTLRGKPLAIAGSSRRAVVLTASYEARPFGVRSAIPLFLARERCPQLIVRPPDFHRYRDVSRQVFAILSRGERAVEALSLDEAFVDVKSADLDEAVTFAQTVRATVRSEVGLTISAGVASGKMVAKIASDNAKPDGLAFVPPGTEAEYLAPMPVSRLWGVGPKTQSRLEERGLTTIGDLARLDDAEVAGTFGRWGLELRDLARGLDRRTVDPEERTRSVSSEETFEYDLSSLDDMCAVLRSLACDVASRLQAHGLRGRTVGIKIKLSDFAIKNRQEQLSEETDDADTIEAAALRCLDRASPLPRAVRLLGVRVAGISEEPPRQMSLLR